MKMERDINRYHSDTLVRRIIEERERFVSAWHRGAGAEELTKIRQNIQQLDDLLWEEATNHRADARDTYRPEGLSRKVSA
jgi:hypothetical protein